MNTQGADMLLAEAKDRADAKSAEIGRLRSALVDIADPTLTADECKKIAREVLGWEPKQEVGSTESK